MFKESVNSAFNQELHAPFSLDGVKQPRSIDRVLAWAEEMGIDQSELARRMGVAPQDITNWKRRGMPAARDEQAAEVLGRTIDEVRGRRPQNWRNVEQAALLADCVAVRHVRIQLSAGATGFYVSQVEDDEGPPIFFRTDWLRARGYNPDTLVAIGARGESMEPTVYDGDTVLVNTDDVQPRDGAVFAVSYEGELLIKRMVRDAGNWWLVSDNADTRRFARKVCDERANIIGRIVYKQSERI